MVDDLRPGDANTVIMANLIDKADDLVRSNFHVILRLLATKVDASVGTM